MLGFAGVAGPATAAPKKLATGKAVDRACHKALATGSAGVATTTATAPVRGIVRARLSASGGDWDVAVFDARSGRNVAGSAAFGSRELAEGFVDAGQALTIQACRISGGSGSATVDTSFEAVASRSDGKAQIVDVKTRTRGAKAELLALGLDVSEHADGDSVEVLAHGESDRRVLRGAGLAYTVLIDDLEQRSQQNSSKDSTYAASNAKTQLPSGANAYRRLPDYEYELKQLAARNPGLVKLITLNHPTIEGRDVVGVEITKDPALNDGKPIFLNAAVHHAREWPAGEHAIEFAYDLVNNYATSARTRGLVDSVRTIVVPIVNPDGFNVSREARHFGTKNAFSLLDYEMKRKNCRETAPAGSGYEGGFCSDNPAGGLNGVDPNRNYGGLWGGTGASTLWFDATFRGSGPFSEPEVQNVRELQATRQITNLITNHTYSNLVLRPPGVADFGFPLENAQYRALGARLAGPNGYANDPSYGLYDTTGSTEDWTFWTAGSLGFTFEIGPDQFHPPYNNGVVDEYLGRGQTAGAGKGGNREAYYEMLAATGEDQLHSVIAGQAPNGSALKITKTHTTETSPVWADDAGSVIGAPMTFSDTLGATMVTNGATFEWDVNPSTRPVVAGRDGRAQNGATQASIPMLNPPGIVAENVDYPPGGPVETIPFTVQGPAQGFDNGRLTVHIDWPNGENDWDVYVYDAGGALVASSASFGDNTEDAILSDPPAGNYTAVIVNYDQVLDDPAQWDDWAGEVRFQAPRPRTETGIKEAWKLTCTPPGGRERNPVDVVVDRGGRVDVGNACR